jgi:cell division protein FtsZ
VGIVTIPFEDEGPDRIGQAMKGVEALKPHVDALLTICNDRIVDMYGDLPVTKAFSKADDILCTAAKGIAEIITKAGMLNVDFKDVQTAMTNSGRAIMGTGVAKGDDRAEKAVQMALDSPLLDNTRIHGAKHVLVNFTYGASEPTLSETSKVKKFLQQEAGHTAHLKMGITQDPKLGDEIAITVIATGFEASGIVATPQEEVQVVVETPQEAFPTPVSFTPETHDIFSQQHHEVAYPNDGMGGMPGDKRLNREKDADNINVPAYLRRGVVLNTTPASDTNHVSRHQIADATEETEQQVQKNKFLHDNVD